MQIPRWAAVAVLAPLGLLMIHSSFVAHSSLGRTPVRDAAQSSAPRAFDEASDTSRTEATVRPRSATAQPPAAIVAPAALDGSAYDAAHAASTTLPSPMSADWAKGKFDHFTHDELREMAERCELRWQLPPFSSTSLPTFANAEEGSLYADALAKERAQYEATLHALHKDLTGDDGPADLRSLRDALRVHPDAEPASVHRAVAQALADGQPPPDGTYARYLHAEVTAGDDFEQRLTATFGADRAHELREAAGPHHTLTGCDSQSAIYRSER